MGLGGMANCTCTNSYTSSVSLPDISSLVFSLEKIKMRAYIPSQRFTQRHPSHHSVCAINPAHRLSPVRLPPVQYQRLQSFAPYFSPPPLSSPPSPCPRWIHHYLAQ